MPSRLRDIEHKLVQVTGELKQTLKIPIAVKVSAFLAAFANVARRLDRAGADAIVMFNRFYQPDIDVKSIWSAPHLELSARVATGGCPLSKQDPIRVQRVTQIRRLRRSGTWRILDHRQMRPRPIDR